MPAFVVDETEEWLVHFADCSLPVGEPYGIAVRMREDAPVAVEVLVDAAEL